MVISLCSTFATTTLFLGAQAALYKAPVHIKDGPVQGYQALNDSTVSNFANWKDITVWKGIPFAASTAGNNRWKAPVPPTPWKKTLYASSFGPACPGAFGTTTSEDCLTVNIWSPAKSANAKLPVAVWSYGAGTTSSNDIYDGVGMANQGIVFVSYNYRTGPFGWLALPELSAESPRNISGNYGLFDQFEVLNWVKENIAAFGGDPNHITSVGQSFGSGAVLHAVNSPLTKGLIVGAIAESGIKDPFDPMISTYGSTYVDYSFLYPFSETFAKSLNATTVKQLRNLTTAELLDGTGVNTFGMGFDPVLDGYAIPSTYLESLIKGPANDVPILVGNNRDEDGVTFDETYTVAQYEAAVEQLYDNDTYWIDTFLKLYPGTNESQATTAYKAQLRDQARVSTWMWATSWARTAISPVYTYEWDHAPPNQDQGAYHASEISYVLNNLYAVDTTPWQADDYVIAEIMSSYWANFIKSGSPNKGGSYKMYKNGSLVNFPYSCGTENTTFNVGDSFGEVYLASKAQVGAIFDYFHNVTTTPY